MIRMWERHYPEGGVGSVIQTTDGFIVVFIGSEGDDRALTCSASTLAEAQAEADRAAGASPDVEAWAVTD